MKVFVTGATGFIGSAVGVSDMLGPRPTLLGWARNGAAMVEPVRVGTGEPTDLPTLTASARFSGQGETGHACQAVKSATATVERVMRGMNHG